MAQRHRLASYSSRLSPQLAPSPSSRRTPLVAAMKALTGRLSLSSSLLRHVIDSLAEGVVVANAEGRFLLFNPAAERMLSMGLMDVPLSEWSTVYRCYHPDTVSPFPSEQLPLARSLRGEVVDDCEVYIRRNGGSGGAWLVVSSRPVTDAHRRVIGGVATIRDISAQKHQLEQQRLLTKIVEETADAVLVTDSTGNIEYVNAAFEQMTGFTRAEVIGRNPRLLKSGRHGRRFYDALWKQLLRGEVFRDTITDRRKNGELYLSSQTITPLKSPDGTISHLVSVARDVTEKRRAQLIESSLRLARQVQQRLFPTSPPKVSGLDAWGVSMPAEAAGGDYFDFLERPTGSLGLVIGDVSGHGIDSAITMAQTRALVRAASRDHCDPGSILSDVNALLVPDLGENRYVGMIAVEVEPRSRAFSYANAGHPSGYLLNGAGRIKMELASTGVVLGLFGEAEFASVRGPDLDGGDLLVLFTDGVTEAEAPDGAVFGAERALDVVREHAHRSAAEILDRLCEAVMGFADGEGQHDDVTAIVCRVLG